MPKSYSLRITSIKKHLLQKLETNSGKNCRVKITRNCAIFAIFALLLSIFGPASADSFTPTPSKHIVIDETCISVSLSSPLSSVFINVTEYDAKQIVKNITVEFCEPVTFLRFTWKILSKKPSYMVSLDDLTVLQYYAIKFSTGDADEPTNVKMNFEIEKEAKQGRDAEVETLLLYLHNGEKMEECAMKKVKEETDDLLYFKTEIEGSSSYVLITKGTILSSWWFVAVIIVVVTLITLIGICCYEFKLTSLRKTTRTGHGEKH